MKATAAATAARLTPIDDVLLALEFYAREWRAMGPGARWVCLEEIRGRYGADSTIAQWMEQEVSKR